MKKLFSALLAGVLTAASVFSVSAASPHGGGLYVFDSSDSEYWAADLSMLDKTAPAAHHTLIALRTQAPTTTSDLIHHNRLITFIDPLYNTLPRALILRNGIKRHPFTLQEMHR